MTYSEPRPKPIGSEPGVSGLKNGLFMPFSGRLNFSFSIRCGNVLERCGNPKRGGQGKAESKTAAWAGATPVWAVLARPNLPRTRNRVLVSRSGPR